MGAPEPAEDDERRAGAVDEPDGGGAGGGAASEDVAGGGAASEDGAGGDGAGGGGAGDVWAAGDLPSTVEPRHGRNLPVEEPAARFHARERPQRYATGVGRRDSIRPLDPIIPYMAPPVARRRRSEWPVMVLVMVIASIVMVGFCVAGFAIYSGYGIPFVHK